MLEQEIVARLHTMAYDQHISVASGMEEEQFEQEIERAHARYHQATAAMAPWLQIRPEKTDAERWADLQERRKDPAHMAWVAKEQKYLDETAEAYKKAVELEIQMMKEAREWEQKRRAEHKKRLAKRHGRLSARASRR